MRSAPWILACLAYAGHGRRVQITSFPSSQSQDSQETANLLLDRNNTSRSHADVHQPREVLATLLSSSKAAAGFASANAGAPAARSRSKIPEPGDANYPNNWLKGKGKRATRRAKAKIKGILLAQARQNKTRRELVQREKRQQPQPFRYLCVLDIEATCDNTQRWQHEIIEFPVVVLDLERNASTACEFHSYVRPTEEPILTDFCKRLTGITQEQVDSAPTLPEVLEKFESWRVENKLEYNETGRNFIFLTHGSFDLQSFLHGECRRKDLEKQDYFEEWNNIKRTYAKVYKPPRGTSMTVPALLRLSGMSFQGRQHSGIDDTRNIARVAAKIFHDGAKLDWNENLRGPRKYGWQV